MKKYSLKTRGDKIRIGGSAIAAAAIFAGTAALILNPVAAAATAAYGGLSSFINRKRQRAPAPKSLEPVSEYSPAAMIAQSISEKIGRVETPKIYVFDTEHVKLPAFIPKSLHNKLLSSVFRGLVGPDNIVMTQKAMDSYTGPELEFIISSRIARLKSDEKSATAYSKEFMRSMSMALIIAPLFFGASALLAPGIPLLAAAGALVGGASLSTTVHKYASRISERRADRNALYFTRDIDSAQDALKKLYGEKKAGKRHIWGENLFRENMCYHTRSKQLAKSFNMVSRYPEAGDMPLPPELKKPKGPRRFDI